MVNAPLLSATMEHIRKFPESHDQSCYFGYNEFGITACFAGRACLLAGYGPNTFAPNVWTLAQVLLGVDDEQALDLFTCANTRQDLERKVDSLLTDSLIGMSYELVPH